MADITDRLALAPERLSVTEKVGYGIGDAAANFIFQTIEALRQFAYGFTIPLLWAMMADVADYSEWRNRRRATAVIFSAIIFGLKAGLGIGGAIGGYLLTAYAYVPNAVQNERALYGIRLAASLYPALAFFLCAVCLYFYRIDKTLELEVSRELTQRRAQFVPSPAVPSAP